MTGLGIPVKVDLPSVGENVVDQPFTGLSYGKYFLVSHGLEYKAYILTWPLPPLRRIEELLDHHFGRSPRHYFCRSSPCPIVSPVDFHRAFEFLTQVKSYSEATKTGILTIGVTAFALAPLQWITEKANALIAAQVKVVAEAKVSKAVKALWAVQLAQLAQPKKFGLVEFVGFPGFFTSKCQWALEPVRKIVLSNSLFLFCYC